MPARSGGRYEIKNGKRVLVERTGYTPEAEAPKPHAPKRATKEKRNADA